MYLAVAVGNKADGTENLQHGGLGGHVGRVQAACDDGHGVGVGHDALEAVRVVHEA